jgi:DNA-binding transcriptional MerR regulator
MDKSPDAFRTISEVAELLQTPAHVLRFWETRFPQVRPVKRAGGRRYYRPSDVALLGGIKRLLHDEGMTIRGVQKILRDQGVRHVAGLGGETPREEVDSIEAELSAALGAEPAPMASDVPVETAQIIALETVLAQKEGRAPAIRRDLFDLDPVEDAGPVLPIGAEMAEEGTGDGAEDTPAPDSANTVPQAAEIPPESEDAAVTIPASVRLRAARIHGTPPADPAFQALRSRALALRARLAEGARRRPR